MADRSAFSRPGNFSEVRSSLSKQNLAMGYWHYVDNHAPWLAHIPSHALMTALMGADAECHWS